jgi:transposase
MAYDKKFRRPVIAYKDAGHTFAEVYEAFGVNPRRYYSRKKKFEETGSLEYKPVKERDGKTDKVKPRELAEKHPDRYLKAFAEQCNVCPQAVHIMFVEIGITRKKTFAYSEKSEEKRKRYVTDSSRMPEEKRVYADECGIKKRLNREYGRA